MTLPGPSRTIIVQPIEQPAPPEPAPEPEPERERRAAPATSGARARARPRAGAGRGSLNTATIVEGDETAADRRADPRDPGLVDRVCERLGSLRGVTGGGWKAGGEPTVAVCNRDGGDRASTRRHRAPEPDCGCGLYAVHPHAAEAALAYLGGRRARPRCDRGDRRGLGAGRAASVWVSRPVRAADRVSQSPADRTVTPRGPLPGSPAGTAPSWCRCTTRTTSSPTARSVAGAVTGGGRVARSRRRRPSWHSAWLPSHRRRVPVLGASESRLARGESPGWGSGWSALAWYGVLASSR